MLDCESQVGLLQCRSTTAGPQVWDTIHINALWITMEHPCIVMFVCITAAITISNFKDWSGKGTVWCTSTDFPGLHSTFLLRCAQHNVFYPIKELGEAPGMAQMVCYTSSHYAPELQISWKTMLMRTVTGWPVGFHTSNWRISMAKAILVPCLQTECHGHCPNGLLDFFWAQFLQHEDCKGQACATSISSLFNESWTCMVRMRMCMLVYNLTYPSRPCI